MTTVEMTTAPFAIAPDESRSGSVLDSFGTKIWIKLTGADTGGRYTIIESLTPPGGGPPLHCHSREDESFHVLEGMYEFIVDGKRFPVEPGGFVFAPRGTVHTFRVVGDQPGRMTTVMEPAGMDDFFVEISAATNKTGIPDPAVVIPIFKRYGLELAGPPLS